MLVLLALSAGAFAQRYNAGLNSGTGGNFNTYVGPYAGQKNSAPNNTFMGTAAGQFSTSANNTYLGYFAGYWNSSANNTFVGYQAGARPYSTGGGNTFNGSGTGTNNLAETITYLL